MATPNSEQLKAIEHKGGVLLKAGAGSGKTFVLKEHMVHLSENWIKEFKETNNNISEFEMFIKKKFRKIILMTFTKKAAGELSIRLDSEFQKIHTEATEDKEYWEVVLTNLSYLNVSTIHGFCFKIIRMGFFPDISADQTILSEGEYKDCIGHIFEQYLSDENSINIAPEFLDILMKEKKAILNSMTNIFSDPTLRNEWSQVIEKKNLGVDNNVDEVVHDLFEMLGLDEIFKDYFNPESFNEFAGKKWFEFLKKFCDEKRKYHLSLEGIVGIDKFFAENDYKMPVKPSIKTVDEHVVNYYEKVKSLKDYLKKNGEHFSLYQERFETNIASWFEEIAKLVSFIEHEYSMIEGVTFSDLEYIVYKGLNDEKVQGLISQEFEYFIIDEFQDTSFIQFDIVAKIINNNYDKLFCVGDLKQAIYGFRGGELGVFLNCEKRIKQNLSLKNNYRSSSDVINFNNQFFKYIFSVGPGFKGLDEHAVEVEFQNVPETTGHKGEIYRINAHIDFMDTENKVKNLEVDYIEALTLRSRLKELINGEETIAVLYKRLKPSLILTKLLMQAEIGFTAQIKIPFLEDPIVGIFKCLIEGYFDRNINNRKFQMLLLDAYFSLIIGKGEFDLREKDLDHFYQNVKRYGLYEAFCFFIEAKGIHNSNYKNNLLTIKSFISTSFSQPDVLLKLLSNQKEISYSLDFQYGVNAHKIKIMSAHASKGLEFHHVLLGGIYTNDSAIINTSMIGKMPSSFKWTKSIHGKDKFKTPHLIFEELLEKRKDFSESKRLFYVANTRAEETLGWVDIQFGDLKRSKSPTGAWVNAIKLWEKNCNNFEDINNYEFDVREEFSDNFLDSLDSSTPLFHIDNLGISPCVSKLSKVYLPELSVTKLTSLAQCPRKFYLQNICKITSDDLELLNLKTQSPYSFEEEMSNDELNSKTIFKSSAQRGTQIHEEISDILISDFTKSSSHESVKWAVENLAKYRENFYFYSEKQIKFELFGYMISGIPDLILSHKGGEDSTQIWDFKTGAFSEEKLKPYYFQLYTYAYSQYVLEESSLEKPTKLVLCFVDEKKIVEKTVSFEDVEKYLTKELAKTMTPDVVDLSECEFCPFELICQK